MTTQFRPASMPEQKSPSGGDTPPEGKRRRGRPPGSGGRPRKSLREPIERLLVTINLIFRALAPTDALDSVEIGSLATAIDEEAKSNARFRKAIETLIGATGGGGLIPVIAIIAGRRLARHGIIPGGRIVDEFGSMFLQMSNAKPSEAQEAMDSILGAMGLNPNGMMNDDSEQSHASGN